MTSSIATIAD